MTPELQQTIKQYETLKLKIAELEREADALKPAIVQSVPLGTKIESEYGTLTISSRGKWEYSDIVKTMEDRLKQQQKQEKSDGTAIEVPGEPFVVFKASR